MISTTNASLCEYKYLAFLQTHSHGTPCMVAGLLVQLTPEEVGTSMVARDLALAAWMLVPRLPRDPVVK